MPVLESMADQAYMHQLPKVSFRIVTDDKTLSQPAGVHSEQMKSYGYNDFSDFERDEFYIRHIEPIESELAVQVEYDMDEQDQAWLEAVNLERKKDQSGVISYEVFEIMMDKLEKEWFNLIKRIPQPPSHLPVEDSKCAVCDDGEGENSNAIVFCDGCNLAVHQDCYGVPYIPEGQWLCRKCTVSPENPVSCLFCPNEGGAFKQTSTGHWAHLLCAIWIPELSVGNQIYMEPVEGVQDVPKNRWKLVCSLCRERVGACIQCNNKNCFTAFHVTCARQLGLLQNMKSLATEGTLIAYCEKHLPAGSRSDLLDEFSDETPAGPRLAPVTTKSARAHAKSYRPGPPIVPHMIVQRLLDYVARLSIRKRQGFVERLCRYWSLKREARRGAPLLKRLHLEPWTASSASRQQTEAEKEKKLEFLTKLRNDLEKVRMLAELVRKRERAKLQQYQLLKDVVESFVFPHYGKLRVVLEKISIMDRGDLFMHPVNRADVPDYFDVVKEPMCWLWIEEKLDKNVYMNVAEFNRDVLLVLDNAMLYNNAESPFHRTAKRIKTNVRPLLDELDLIGPHSALLDSPPDPAQAESSNDDIVGDLEPSLLLLRALLLPDRTEPNRDLLASLFAFQLEPPKPPSPVKSSPDKRGRKYLSHAERRQRQQEREERARERVSERATRASQAAQKAFAAEAGVAGSSEAEISRRQSLERDTQGGETSRSGRRKSGRGMTTVDQPSSSSSRRKQKTMKEDEQDESVGADGLHPQSKRQVGVAGLKSFAVMTDRERREAERAMELVVAGEGAVDPAEEFRRFNVGWVLPEGTKRRRAGGSAAPSTSARSNGTNNGHERKLKTSSSKIGSVPLPEVEETAETSPLSEIQGGSGSSSESLSEPPEDTPKPSRASTKRKAAAGGDEDEGQITPRSSKRARKGERRDDAGDVDMAEGEVQMDKEASVKVEEMRGDLRRVSPRKSVKGKSKSKAGQGDQFPPGTLVWAKAPSFPYFPAETVDPASHDDEDLDVEIPQQVLDQRPPLEDKGPYWLVRFFDKENSYSWVGAGKLELLGESNDTDALYLSGKERGRSGSKFRSTNMKNSVKKAYRDALSHLEHDDADE